jgi:hypothetical protein
MEPFAFEVAARKVTEPKNPRESERRVGTLCLGGKLGYLTEASFCPLTPPQQDQLAKEITKHEPRVLMVPVYEHGRDGIGITGYKGEPFAGYIYMTRSAAINRYMGWSTSRLSPQARAGAEREMLHEIERLNAYLTGEVYEVVTNYTDPEDESKFVEEVSDPVYAGDRFMFSIREVVSRMARDAATMLYR